MQKISLRRDIFEWLVEKHEHGSKWLKVYQHENGLLYRAQINYGEKNKITFFSANSVCGVDDREIEEHFNVKFATNSSDIICRCGESQHFSASYGNYELNLTCNMCGHKFTAYSG